VLTTNSLTERKGREGKRKGIKLICPIRIGLMAINLTSRKGNLHRKNLIQNQMMLKAKIQSMSLSKIFFGGRSEKGCQGQG
jgi:folate-dependent tRNA-U54 methylase TrmFO/GidA